MRILLLTDTPPSTEQTAGIVLDKLCRFLPKGSIYCFSPINPAIEPLPSQDLAGAVIQLVDKPRERALYGSAFGLTKIIERFRGVYNRHIQLKRLIKKATTFGKDAKVDAVWALLQGQTCIQMAVPLAKALNVPLYTQIWDPPIWWLNHHRADAATTRVTLEAFNNALIGSRGVATASWAMTQAYDHKYNISSVPVIASHDPEIACHPFPTLHSPSKLFIGMAGQFYAKEEWEELLLALNSAGWIVRGRQVYIKVAGHHLEPHNAPPGRIEFLGWLKQPDLIQALSKCDILYCPYPFAKSMEEVSGLSFPSKLVTYLAAGRPIAFHGPAQSSPGVYVKKNSVGLVADNPKAASIYNVIDWLVRDSALYSQCARNTSKAFEADFTLRQMQEKFYTFLGIDNLSLSNDTATDSTRIIDNRHRKNSQPKQTHSSFLFRMAGLLPDVQRLQKTNVDLESLNSHLQSEIVSLKVTMAYQNETRDLASPHRDNDDKNMSLSQAIVTRDEALIHLLRQRS